MPTLEQVLAAIASHERLRHDQIRVLSDLYGETLLQFDAVWQDLPDRERINILAILRRQGEEDVVLDFNRIYELALDDPNADVRRMAIAASVDDDSNRLLDRLLDLCANDPEETVRAAAAERLGGFAYEAEVGTLPEEIGRKIEEVLLQRAQSETEGTAVRAAAVASAGYLSTEAVRAEVGRALTRGGLKLAAVRAIGRNCDPIWTDTLREQMGDPDEAIRREAAIAAADYEDTVPSLADLVDDKDRSVRLAAIDSLGKIGTAEARDVLVYCYESTDEEIRSAAADALREIETTEDPLGSVGYDDEEDA